MTKKKDRRGSVILDSFAEHIQAAVCELSDEELDALHKACKRVTTRNCWWGRFDVTPGVLPFVKEELRERPIRRKQEADAITKAEASR